MTGFATRKIGYSGFNLGNGGCRRSSKKSFGPAEPKTLPMHRINVAVDFRWDGMMEVVRDKSFWGAVVFVALFVTSIVVLLADNAMAR
jgi:hypothetical protein